MKKLAPTIALATGALIVAVVVIYQVFSLDRYFFSGQDADSPEDKFLRSAYVLQKLGGPAAEENLEIPARIKRSDDAEALVHHPDKVYVLNALAEDLAFAHEAGVPMAELFEGYARMDLGEDRAAARLFSDYVADNPYQARHYRIICTLLEKLHDYPALLRFCAEWREREAACTEDIAVFSWRALSMMGRYREAAAYMLQNADCLGREKLFYAARAVHEIPGEEKKTADLLKAARAGYSEGDPEGDRLWNKLLSMDLKPALP